MVTVCQNLHNPNIHYEADTDSKEAITVIVSRQYDDNNGREGQRQTTMLWKSLSSLLRVNTLNFDYL